MNKKAYIQPATDTMGFVNHLMEIPASLPKGNSGDPEIEDEDEEPIYSFSKDVNGVHIIISYSAGRGVATIPQGF